MSDDEEFPVEEENNEILAENDEDEEKILIQRTLVHLVQQIPPLYDKKLKEYCGKRFDKAKGWADAGRAMVPPMTGMFVQVPDMSLGSVEVRFSCFDFSGAEAQKEFYKIRQRFGKELRAYRKSCAGKSGQANTGLYISKWPLYSDCLFLADIITPKK